MPTKAIVQTIPEDKKTDHLYDLSDDLGAVVRSIDSSLLDEWERIASGDLPAGDVIEEVVDDVPADITTDRRAFTALVRNLSARLLRWLALARWDEAAELAGDGWTFKRVEDAMAPYGEEHEELRFDPAARAPKHLQIDEREDAWEVRQVMTDPDELNDWSFVFTVDLAQAREDGQPTMQLVSIGPS